MRRRKPDASLGYPPELAAFNGADWRVEDPEDPLQVGYARITWGCARRAYAAGEDWRSFLEPPVWWKES